MELKKSIFLALLGYSFVTAAYVFGEDFVEIGAILANPNSYHLKTVNLRGTAMNTQALDPSGHPNNPGRRGICPGALSFTLTDGTGSIEVKFLGDCETLTTPDVKPPSVSDGDRVRVQARIQAPSIIHGQRGNITILGEEQDTVFAVANAIRPAK